MQLQEAGPELCLHFSLPSLLTLLISLPLPLPPLSNKIGNFKPEDAKALSPLLASFSKSCHLSFVKFLDFVCIYFLNGDYVRVGCLILLQNESHSAVSFYSVLLSYITLPLHREPLCFPRGKLEDVSVSSPEVTPWMSSQFGSGRVNNSCLFSCCV